MSDPVLNIGDKFKLKEDGSVSERVGGMKRDGVSYYRLRSVGGTGAAPEVTYLLPVARFNQSVEDGSIEILK